MATVTTVAWHPEAKPRYEELLDTLHEYDGYDGLQRVDDLIEAVDEGVSAIKLFPAAGNLTNILNGAEFRGRRINYPRESSFHYFIWYVFLPKDQRIFIQDVGATKPFVFSPLPFR